MSEQIEDFNKHVSYLNKLAPYKLRYRCSEDCKVNGCPSHLAEFEINHTCDVFIIKFDDEVIYLDGVKMAMIKDFIERFVAI